MTNKNCSDCVHFDANKNGFLPLCSRKELKERWRFQLDRNLKLVIPIHCDDQRSDEKECGQDGKYFEPVQRELTDGENSLLKKAVEINVDLSRPLDASKKPKGFS